MKKIISIIMLAAALLPCFIFTITAAAPVTMDTSHVYEDLKKMTINGAAFDENNYPENKEADYISVLSFLEYGYAENGDQSNYGIYIYVYNPSKKNILNSTKNKIQIAGVADKDSSETYHKYELDELSRYDGGLYIKYKISNLKPVSAPKILYDYVKPSERIYKVSGIELHESGKYNATDFPVSGTYAYTGYQKGYAYNLSAKSSLECNQENLTTIKLDLHHTTYRTLTSSAGLDHQNEVMSVYFAFPKKIYDQYKYLYSMQGEYYEYKIESIVTESKEAVEQWEKLVGTSLADIEGYDSIEEFIADNIRFLSTRIVNEEPQDDVLDFSVSFNYPKHGMWLPLNPDYVLRNVPYFYYRPELVEKGQYDVLPQEVIDKVNTEGLYYIPEGVTEDGHTEGYTKYDICMEDTFDLNSYKSNHDFVDYFYEAGWSGYFEMPEDDIKSIEPIVEVTEDMVKSSNNFLSKNYLIYSGDVDDFRNFYYEKTKENVIFLFRFTANDYYAEPLITLDQNDNIIDEVESYYARQTYIKDFDVMSLTFMDKSNNLVVIPVAADPIDIAGGIGQTPEFNNDWLWQLIGIILGAVMIGFLAWVVYEIFSMIAESIDARRG